MSDASHDSEALEGVADRIMVHAMSKMLPAKLYIAEESLSYNSQFKYIPRMADLALRLPRGHAPTQHTTTSCCHTKPPRYTPATYSYTLSSLAA
jgi:hypothetical protein